MLTQPIIAIRVHNEEFKTITTERLQAAFRMVLTRNELADLVIPDLARWEDWTVIVRLEELFQQSNKATQFVKIPIINYLRVCPKPEAALALARCTALDPVAVRRAEAAFPRVNRDVLKDATNQVEQELTHAGK